MAVALPTLANDEVELIHARSIVSTKYGISVQTTQFSVRVKNLGYAKQVAIHYRQANGQWQDVALQYHGPAEQGAEIWAGQIPNYGETGQPGMPMALDFVISYRVSGRQFWDNNAGRHYQLAPTAGDALFGRNLFVPNHAPTVDHFWGGQYYGNVVLKNLGYDKDVQVVYTTDQWRTQRVAHASFSPHYWASTYAHTANPNPAGQEVWSYTLDVGAATEVEYAVRYQVNGQTYWDNNFGRNYRTSLKQR